MKFIVFVAMLLSFSLGAQSALGCPMCGVYEGSYSSSYRRSFSGHRGSTDSLAKGCELSVELEDSRLSLTFDCRDMKQVFTLQVRGSTVYFYGSAVGSLYSNEFKFRQVRRGDQSYQGSMRKEGSQIRFVMRTRTYDSDYPDYSDETTMSFSGYRVSGDEESDPEEEDDDPYIPDNIQ